MTHPNSATHCPERLCCEVRAPVRRDHQRDVEGADPPVMDEPGRRLRRAVPGRQQHQVAAEDILHLQNITKRMTVSLGERTKNPPATVRVVCQEYQCTAEGHGLASSVSCFYHTSRNH